MPKLWSYQEVQQYKECVKEGRLLEVAFYLRQDKNFANYPIGMSPVASAIDSGNAEMLALLFENGAWVEGLYDVFDQHDASALITDPEILKVLVEYIDIDTIILKESLLHIACRFKNLDAINFLLQSGANPNIPGRKNKDTPLLAALIDTEPVDLVIESLKLLLEHGADPDTPIREMESAIAVAEFFIHKYEVIQLLKSYSKKHQQQETIEYDR